MMKTIQGLPVAPGVVVGKAFIVEPEGYRIPERNIAEEEVENEIARFHEAVRKAGEDLVVHRESTRDALGTTFAEIFEAQLQILSDPRLIEEEETLIRTKLYPAGKALVEIIDRHAGVLRMLESEYIAEKANDLKDIEKRILGHLLGEKKESLRELSTPVIIIAANLTPSDTVKLDRKFVKAIVTEDGGIGGHTAILAAAMEIPCIVGTDSILPDVHDGDTVIVDAKGGTVVIRPDDATILRYDKLIKADYTRIENLDSFRDLPAVTTDGTRLEIHANIEFPYEAKNAVQKGAEGIGLFRTEFLYLTQDIDPTEEEHFESYKEAAVAMKGKPVVIRTFDFGDDKSLQRHGSSIVEHNPALGLRGIRLALKRWSLFRTQLRAILRASAFGDVRVMFPLVSTVREFRQARRSALNEIMDELIHEGVDFNDKIPVGMMVEIPAAVVMLDRFAVDADFFSIGTNDLIQYTMAVDRGNREVSHLFNAEDPAVLRLIRRTIVVSEKESTPLSLCGQMGGNPHQVVLLLGLGLRSISCAPSSIPAVKQVCRQLSIQACQDIALKALKMSNAHDVKFYVRNQLYKLLPDPLRIE